MFDVASGGGGKVGACGEVTKAGNVGSASMVARNGIACMSIGKMQTL